MKPSPQRYEDPSRKDWVKGIAVIAVYVAAISLGAFLLLPDWWYLWLIGVAGGLVSIVGWHTKSYAYRCRNCGREFEISFLTNLVAPHGIDKEGAWEWLKCPHCRKRGRANIIKMIENSNK